MVDDKVSKYFYVVAEYVHTFLGFCLCLLQSGSVDKQMAGMAYFAHSGDNSAEFLMTCNEA